MRRSYIDRVDRGRDIKPSACISLSLCVSCLSPSLSLSLHRFLSSVTPSLSPPLPLSHLVVHQHNTLQHAGLSYNLFPACTRHKKQQVRKSQVIDIARDNLGGQNFLSRTDWRKTSPWTIPPGWCESSADGLTFRSTVQGDMDKASPMAMPQLNGGGGPNKPAYLRQRKAYHVPRKETCSGQQTMR